MDNQEYSLKLKTSVCNMPHLHQGIECILILKGSVQIAVEDVWHELCEDDLIVINRNQVHAISSLKGGIMLVLSVTDKKLLRECGALTYNHIACSEFSQNDAVKDKACFELKRIMVEMFSVRIEKPYGYNLAMNMLLLRFLHTLFISFSQQTEEVIPESAPRKAQLADILYYIEQNYKDTLTLDEVAAHFFMSPTYFSRYFKNAAGEGYLHYLQKFRLEKSLSHLRYSDASILEVALDHGFKNARAYANCFMKQFGQPPSAYRKKYVSKAIDDGDNAQFLLEEETDEDARIEFLRCLGRYAVERGGDAVSDMVAEISVTGEADTQIFAKEAILIIDTPEAALRKNFALATSIKEQINAKYVYFQLLEYKSAEKGVSVLCLEDLLTAIETIEQYSLVPFMRIDFSQTVFTGLNEEILQYLQGSLHCALEAMAVRFSAEHAREWKFELVCSNFMQLQSELFYNQAYYLIHRYFPNSAIGLFAQTDDDHETAPQFDSLIKYSMKIGKVPRFITFHSFQNRIKKRYPKDVKFFRDESSYHLKTVRSVRNTCTEAGLEAPLYLTVWNTLSGENNSEISIYIRAGIIWDFLLKIGSQVQGIGYRFTVTEVCPYSGECYGAPLNLFILSNAKRPVCFVAGFYKRMAGNVLFQSDNVCVVRNHEQEIIAAMWNLQLLNPANAIDCTLTDSLAMQIEVKLTGLKNKYYHIKRFTVDSDNNGTLSQMIRSGYPDWRDNDALSYMRDTSVGDLIVLKEEVKDSTMLLSSTVEYNGIVLYVIKL